MDRPFLIASTLCYLTAVVRTLLAVRERISLHGRFNFFAIGLGFLFQTAFLSIRGHALGRCPLTNLFEVFVFLAWSVALIYLLIGPAYRLSLMGAFTAPLVFALQTFALAALENGGRLRRLAFLWGHLARPAFALVRAETRGGALHSRL